MFITLQFPLFDYRFFKTDPNKTERPKWPEPGNNARVRYFGEILGRNKKYLGPWDDEKKYCNAAGVLNFCGLKEEHFFKSLYSNPYHARILFRRFQSDGRCMAKFEVGFSDQLRNGVATQANEKKTSSFNLYKYVERYLLCPVKIKVGSRLSDYLPLIEAGEKLRDAYYWTTTKGKKSFEAKDIKHQAEPCEPALLIQFRAGEINPDHLFAQKVDMPFLSKEGIELYCTHISYTIGRRKYHLKTWMIITADEDTPLLSGQFRTYNQTVRYLRINLLRIHVETCMQKKLVETFGTTDETYKIKDPAVRDRLYFYLHKILLNLTNIQRNDQPQIALIEAAFRLDEYYYGSMRIEDQVKVLDEYKTWLKELELSPKNQRVLGYVQKSAEDLRDQQKQQPENCVVFISYNHADEITAALLKDKLEQEKITVILDSASMQAGTAIKDFISKSILRSHAILSVVSANSLTSGWVGVETINAMFIKDFFPEKKFIACCLDTDFMKDGFIERANIKIDQRITAIKSLAKSRSVSALRSTDIDDEWRRLESLRLKLPDIIAHLKNDLGIAIREKDLNGNFPKILEAIRS
ncbi:toll/interleukin-1 receptor domain-containing protein [Agriterribacter sp.]|uniref:toll/interleukin-1 receptor domain-containing protein n=1 Tax=Agriterribacter sp. TaxID=2821509 RepID=UPI002BB155F5|nr:toll/interleukin-1 receptor domain-containing protein [Agriterribacter sp.]HRP57785.1 toll/interleukin-1 receptor domain-containing protein [Agriterribacter sp.]